MSCRRNGVISAMPQTPEMPVSVPPWLISHHSPGLVFSLQLPGRDKPNTITLKDAWPVHWWSDTAHVLQVLGEMLQPQNIPDPLDLDHVLDVLRNVDADVLLWVKRHPVAYLLYATRCRTCEGNGTIPGTFKTCPACLGVGIDPLFKDRLNPADVLKWGAYTAP